ncbi:hypothetical protein B0H11DRAFT_1903590 [Mycena galericulata]|nr:hypothetical protein B0H11DRAFT_1903590 [Mycena galericulata]
MSDQPANLSPTLNSPENEVASLTSAHGLKNNLEACQLKAACVRRKPLVWEDAGHPADSVGMPQGPYTNQVDECGKRSSYPTPLVLGSPRLSAFPPLPSLPEANVHHVMLGRPDQASSIASIWRSTKWKQAEWPDYTIYIEEKTGRKRTFRETKNRISLGAAALGASVSDGGLDLNGNGDEIVGLLGDNSLEFIDIVHSLLSITTPFALISTYSTRFELVHALKLTKATRLFVDAKLLKNVLAAIEDPDVHIAPDKIYILAGNPPKNRKSFSQMINTVQRKKVPLESPRPAKKDTLAYLVMSSGTSGLPKGASNESSQMT